jgi:hypothetical protein
MVWKNVAAGIYNLSAVATDNKNAKGNSQVVQITVSVLTADSAAVMEQQEAILYPNPNDGHFSIKFPDQIQEEKVIEVFNVSGQKVFSTSCFRDETEIQFDLSSVSRGLYILRITDSKSTRFKKFIRQ